MRSLALLFFGLVVAAAAVGLPGCNSEHRPRVLVLGIDGATFKAISPLMQQNRVPNLSALTLAGTWGPLHSFPTYLSPRVWTTIATGKTPAAHGITGWIRQEGDDAARLLYSYDRVGHALWNIFSDDGKTVGLVNWLVTYPPEVIRGVVVSDHALSGESQAREDMGALFARARGREYQRAEKPASPEQAIFPKSWSERVLDARHIKEKLTPTVNPFRDDRPLPALFDRKRLTEFFDRDQQLTSIALEIDRALKPDLMMVLLQGIDRASHSLWACTETAIPFPEDFKPTPEELSGCRSAVYDYYAYTDALIGRILKNYTDDDLVIVLSDHGFETIFKGALTGGHETKDAAQGVIFARGPRIERGRLLKPLEVTVNDITPTVLAWSSKPTARDMQGHVAPFLITDPDAVPIEPIDTYATTPIVRVGDTTSGGEAAIMDQLQALGYVD